MVELIAIIILGSSLIGIGATVFRKIPILLNLPETTTIERKESLILRLKSRIGNISIFRNFSYELFLQKILTKIRILILRTENMTFLWLQKLRENNKKRTLERTDKYWEKLKKAIVQKK